MNLIRLWSLIWNSKWCFFTIKMHYSNISYIIKETFCCYSLLSKGNLVHWRENIWQYVTQSIGWLGPHWSIYSFPVCLSDSINHIARLVHKLFYITFYWAFSLSWKALTMDIYMLDIFREILLSIWNKKKKNIYSISPQLLRITSFSLIFFRTAPKQLRSPN